MPTYGLWSPLASRWYVDGAGIVYSTTNKSIAMAQLVAVESSFKDQIRQVEAENARRVNEYNTKRAQKSGLTLPQIVDRNGRPLPGQQIAKPLPPMAPGDGPQLITIVNAKWSVEEIGRDGFPKIKESQPGG